MSAFTWAPVVMPEPVEIHNVDGVEVLEFECKNLPPRNRVFVRRAHDLSHYLGAELVQKRAWFTDNSMSDVMVMENTNIRNPGGLVLVMSLLKNNPRKAEDIVGFAFSWGATGNRQGACPTYVFSNLVGVLPSHQGNNFATILKSAQRRHYLKWWDSSEFVGTIGPKKEMLWTVYPVLAGNHHLNFACLGARCEAFYPNLYGPIEGGLYGGLDTDRLEMTWDLENPQTLEIHDEPISMLNWSETGPVEIRLSGFNRKNAYSASFPTKFQDLKTEDFGLAARWQRTIGVTIQTMISEGYYIAGFQRGRDFGKFIFIAKE